MEKRLYKNKYRVDTYRLRGWDYRNSGVYFITIPTKNRFRYFGEIIDKKMHLNEIGKIADKNFKAIGDHFPNIKVDEYVIMPDHVHWLLVIDDYSGSYVENPDERLDKNAEGYFSHISPKSESISTAIRSYKSACTREINLLNKNLNFKWQGLFYDKIARDERAYWNFKNYIKMNPERMS